MADMGRFLLTFLEQHIELVYAPLLMSATDYGPVDVLFLTGAVRTQEDLENIRQARERARILVSMGSCAVFGGIPGLGNLHSNEELLDTAYELAPSLKAGSTFPKVNVPGLVEQVRPVDAFVKVDYSMTGCPPPPPVMAQFLLALLKKIPMEKEEQKIS